MKRESLGGRVFSYRNGWFAALALLTWACAEGANGDAGPSNGNGGTSSSGGKGGSSSSGGKGGSSSSGGSSGSASFGGTNGVGGSSSGGTAGSSGSAGTSGGNAGSAGSGGSSGSAGSAGSAGSGGSSGSAGSAGSGGTSGGGNGGSGGTDEPSFGGAGSLDDCNAETVDDDVAVGETWSGPADSCVSLTVSGTTVHLHLMAQVDTTDSAYPISLDYASCIGTGSSEFTADFSKAWFYGTSTTDTIPNPNCLVYVKLNGESSDTVSFIHYE